MISVFRSKKTWFLAIFLIELSILSLSPFLALAQEKSLEFAPDKWFDNDSNDSDVYPIEKKGIQGLLAKIIGFLQGLWQLIANNWTKLADSLKQFFDQTSWPKIKQGRAYLENEFSYRKSIFPTELKKEIEEITLDALRLTNIFKKQTE